MEVAQTPKSTRGSLVVGCLLLLLLYQPARAQVVRIKDITKIEGVRTNKLFGTGLVAGLNGTGGKNPTTRQFASNMLQRLGQRADPTLRQLVRNDAKEKTDNLSVVAVQAELPPFAKPGSEIDVVVSTMDDASSLQGGQLIVTPLFGVDGKVHALASGLVSTGGFSFGGEAATVQKNHPTTGRIPDGATVEESVCPPPIGQNGIIRLLLRDWDSETARRITMAINEQFPGVAATVDAGTLQLILPTSMQGDVYDFVGVIGGLEVLPDVRARVVINERTGTVIVGDRVRLSRVAITHADLAIITAESPAVSQPAPFSQGETQVLPQTTVDVIEEKKQMSILEESATVGDLAQALNALGVTPRDLSSIFQQLKAAGALHADILFK